MLLMAFINVSQILLISPAFQESEVQRSKKKKFLDSLDINEVSSILNVTHCIKKALLGLHKLISLSHLKHTRYLLLVLSGLELDDAAR